MKIQDKYSTSHKLRKNKKSLGIMDKNYSITRKKSEDNQLRELINLHSTLSGMSRTLTQDYLLLR